MSTPLDDGFDGPDEITADDLLSHGWLCDSTGESWWLNGLGPENTVSFPDACMIYDESRHGFMEDYSEQD